MPARKQSNGSVRPWTITPEDVRDFRRAMELQGDPVHCDEYREIGERLFRSFDCLLWVDDILDIEEWRPPADYDLPEYERAYAIRKALEEAAGRPLMRPNGNGLQESEEVRKRADESLPRARAG